MATLYIVATPIGNLEDVTKRTLRILSEVDLILCEDTRVTKKLLERYRIETPTLSYHQHSKLKKVEEIVRFLREGKKLALVSDAGTPGVSDPGNKLVREVVNAFGHQAQIIPVPGPSAAMAAASISGISMDKFLFLGFPPVKKRRKSFFEEMLTSRYPVIFYESTYRIVKALKEIREEAERRSVILSVVVCRELTKKFETVYRGEIGEITREMEKGETRGEFVVVLWREK
jgi:16S rRNA (cytidine1402-2'-O)-methyltransferase